ncbi:hypothetical protein BGZ76_009221 [Entomortierella beljakovae]|nr:hypothetical protein BGZ76_009221 [Entomortierella beljakovae]
MSTEAVLCVSLALVLLTRIYVFISPPEFLEEHKDRRYHEYNLYRQYHLHKQYDKSDPDHKRLLQDKNDDTSSLHSSSSTPNSRRRTTIDSDSILEELFPSDELILLSGESGSRPFPLPQLTLAGLDTHNISHFSHLSNSSASSLPLLSPLSPTSASTTPHSPKESKGIWSRILGSSESASEPGYLSLDINEINYNGSMSEFVNDPEIQETVEGIKAGVRDMTKECPTMTMVWESGRWCCLEGRTLYILRALEWKGQVRVRVLVDKDPMTLAVTEDYWKAAVMGGEFGLSTPAMSSTSTSTSVFTSPLHFVDSPNTPATPSLDSDLRDWNFVESPIKTNAGRVQMSATKIEYGASTIGISLEEPQGGSAQEVQGRISMCTAESLSFPGTPTGHDADDEGEDDDDEVESDGYMEDDEGGEDDDEEEEDKEVKGIEQRFGTIDLDSRSLGQQRQQKYIEMQGRHGGKFGNGVGTVKLGEKIEKAKAKGDDKHDKQVLLKGSQSQSQQKVIIPNSHSNHRHERKISIPDFMLPPPLNDERAYLIIDPSLAGNPVTSTADGTRDNPIRRDSGHGASP